METSLRDDLEKRMHAFQDCIENRDVGAAEDLLDGGFALVLVHPARGVIPRQQWLAMLSDYIVRSYQVEEKVIDLADDLATVLQRVDMDATVQGHDRSGLFIISDIWRLHDGSWRLWRRHSTPLTAGRLPETKP
jgi:hypothetical protein